MLWYRTAKHAENLIGRFRSLSTGGSLADTVGVLNPFRYRSYYYDNETGLYYLQSRYYNPELSRFISADDPKSHQDYSNLISANLYSYANDNPVLYADPDGKATSTPYPGYYIEYNSHTYDSNVKLVQKQLDNVFGYSLDADGYFGPLTKSAVMDFQRKHSQCGGADGIVGPNTWAVLFASNNTPTTPVSPTVNPPVKNPTVPSAQTQSTTPQVVSYHLKPDLFMIQGQYYGGDQGWWFNNSTLQNEGCGTIAAANILAYLALTHPNMRNLFEYGQNVTKNQFMKFVNEVYQYVRPNYFLWVPLGEANDVTWISEVLAFARSRHVSLSAYECIAGYQDITGSIDSLVTFIDNSLRSNYPVAILDALNPYKNPATGNTYDKHWMTITSIMYSFLNCVTIKVSTWGTSGSINFNDYVSGALASRWPFLCVVYFK